MAVDGGKWPVAGPDQPTAAVLAAAGDFCIVGADGLVSLHPPPMHLYKFHEAICPDMVRGMLASTTRFDRFLWRSLGSIKRPDHLVRWARPADVLGPERIARQGRLGEVFLMHRQPGLRAPTARHLDSRQAAERIASIALGELNGVVDLSLAGGGLASATPVPPLGRLHETMAGIFAGALASCCGRAHALPIHPVAHQSGLPASTWRYSRT